MAPYVDAWFGTISACSSTRCAPAPCAQQVAGTGPSNHSPVLGRMLPPPSNAARYGEGPEGVSFVFPSGKCKGKSQQERRPPSLRRVALDSPSHGGWRRV